MAEPFSNSAILSGNQKLKSFVKNNALDPNQQQID